MNSILDDHPPALPYGRTDCMYKYRVVCVSRAVPIMQSSIGRRRKHCIAVFMDRVFKNSMYVLCAV